MGLISRYLGAPDPLNADSITTARPEFVYLVFLNQANQTSESNSTACQSSVSEHLFAGDPASLYEITKSDPDPLPDNINIPILVVSELYLVGNIPPRVGPHLC